MDCIVIECINLSHYKYEFTVDVLYQKINKLSDELAALAESHKTMSFSQFLFCNN